MTKPSIFAAMLVLPLSAGPCLSEGTLSGGTQISEDAMRAISAELYSDILIRACRNGWRYPRSQIENGFKRHLGELRLQLVDQGYTIVPGVETDNSRRSHFAMAVVAKPQSAATLQFGCSRQYWLDE
jgi:hypothetical protein